MEGGRERLLVPGAFLLIITLATLWLTAGLTRIPLIWFGLGQDMGGAKDWKDLISAIIAPGLAILGFGYFCNSIHLALAFRYTSYRWGDFDRFLSTFGIDLSQFEYKCGGKIDEGLPRKACYNFLSILFFFLPKFGKTFREKIEKKREAARRGKYHKYLEERVMAGFHFRLHSRAPKPFKDWTIRRNTAWYIAKTSAIASFMGCLIAYAIVWRFVGGWPWSPPLGNYAGGN